MYPVTVRDDVMNGKGRPHQLMAQIRRKSATQREDDPDARRQWLKENEPSFPWRDYLNAEVLEWLRQRNITPVRLEPLTIYFNEQEEAFEYKMRWG